MMKTRFHWKIIIAFILTPILALGLFFMTLKLVLADSETPPTAVFVFMWIFGILGIWLLLTLILRAKRIKLTDNTITLTRIFTFRRLEYSPTEIITYSVTKREENLFHDYEILQFRTLDKKTHSVVSYEFRDFNRIIDWLKKSKVTKSKIGLNSFLINEYGLSFAIGLIVTTGLIAYLKQK